MRTWRHGTVLALVAGDVAVLVALCPDVHRLVAELAAPHAWFARRGADAALIELAAAALWVVAAWLAIGLLAAAGTQLPGLAGTLAARACRLVLPRIVRNLLAGGAGLGVLLAPVAAGALAPGPAPATSAPAAVPAPGAEAGPAAAALPTPSWPRTPAASAPVPTPRWPSPPPARLTPPTVPTVPTAPTAPTAPTTPRPPAVTATPTVTVAPGDSLWLIAAHRLGPHASAAQITASWPRWYAANRDVIGDDPALIRPGSVLRAPAAPVEEPRP